MATPADQVHRLTEMLVEEVSLVDRAANKRKFLVVKRDSVDPDAEGSKKMATGKEITTGANGGLTAKGGFPPGAKEDDEKKKPAAKAGGDVPPGFKEMVGPLLDKASERLSTLAQTIKGSNSAELNEDGSMPGVPGEIAQEFGAIVALLQQAMSNFPQGAPADDEVAEGEENLDAPPEEMQMAAKAIVAKVGAKMSKERLDRFAQAINVLGSIFSELQNAGGGAPAGAAPAGKAKETDEEKKKTAKAADPDPRDKALERLTTVVADVVKKVDAIGSARGVSNSIPVQGGEQTPLRKGSDDVSWPMDMNRPLTRDTVSKGESFFDD